MIGIAFALQKVGCCPNIGSDTIGQYKMKDGSENNDIYGLADVGIVLDKPTPIPKHRRLSNYWFIIDLLLLFYNIILFYFVFIIYFALLYYYILLVILTNEKN